jgi:hypothetical protein
MLNHLRQHIAATLEQAHSATLATSGPAGLQAHVVPCAASGILLYLLLPCTSDHLLNLEYDPALVVATAEWQVSGRGRVVTKAECAAGQLLKAPGAPWSVVLEVCPTRVAIAQPTGWGAAETIDLE